MELSLFGQITVIYVIGQFFALLMIGVGAFFHVEVCKSIVKYCKRKCSDFGIVAVLFYTFGSVMVIIGLLASIKDLLGMGLIFTLGVSFICLVFIIISCIISLVEYLSDLHKRLGERKYK